MTAPVRLQLSRRKGFVLQAMSQATNGLPAVRVARPSRWGNPYPVAKVRRAQRESMDWAGRCTSPLWISWANSHFKSGRSPDLEAELDAIALTTAIALFAAEVGQFERSDPAGFRAWLAPLRGKNLACSCEIGQPCHADILIALANRPVCEAVTSKSDGTHHE